MAGIIGVLMIAIPSPSAKVSINNKEGVMMPISVRIPSIIDIKNMYPHVIKSIFLRSKISDNAPDSKANRKIGSGTCSCNKGNE